MSATATGLDSKAKEPEADSLKATESGKPVVDAPTADEGKSGAAVAPTATDAGSADGKAAARPAPAAIVQDDRGRRLEARMESLEAMMRETPLAFMAVTLACGVVVALVCSIVLGVALGQASAVLWTWSGVGLAIICLMVPSLGIVISDGLDAKKTKTAVRAKRHDRSVSAKTANKSNYTASEENRD